MNVNAFPTANLGQQPVANSLSVTPASDIADPTYIGDIRFGEALPVGDNVIGKVKIDQAIPGTTNLVNVNGGASQTADIKVTLDSETIAVTGPLTDAQLSAQSLAKDSSLTNILNKIIAEPSTAAKQDLIITALGLIATEATTGDIKTATESLAALISAGSLAVSIAEELPAGTQLVGKVGIDQTTPGTTNLVNVNGGASQTADIKVTLDSESVAVTGPLTDAQLTTQALAKEATLGTMQADIALMKADLAAILAILES